MRGVARGLDPKALGEFGLIEAIRHRALVDRPEWRVAIGDDAAVLRPRRGVELVWTTDTLVEDVHFRWSLTDARSLGAKSLAVSLSDLGAMGSRPLGFLLSLAIPVTAEPERVQRFISGLLACGRAARCPLVGGDTVSARTWVVTVAAVGELPQGRALLRSAARAGDRIFVTGSLGGAALGLLELERGVKSGAAVRRQLAPRPPLEVGPKLLRGRLARAAIDLSDGLAQDLGHLTAASGVAAQVALDRLPLARGFRARAEALGLDPLALALHGGEDYELLFTSPSGAPPAAALSRRLGCPVSEIGSIRPGLGVHFTARGEPVSVPALGWDHFKTHRANSET
jgi:thiamine-monophosphate kinase